MFNLFEISAWFTSFVDRWVSDLWCRDTRMKVQVVVRTTCIEHNQHENHMDVYSLVSDLLDVVVVWVVFWPMVSLAIHSEAIEFDCMFSWSLAIRILTMYVGFNRFRFTVWSRIHLNKIYRSWYKRRSPMWFARLSSKSLWPKQVWILKKNFYRIH